MSVGILENTGRQSFRTQRDSGSYPGSAEEEKVNSNFDRKSDWERLELPQDQSDWSMKAKSFAIAIALIAIIVLVTLSLSWPYTISAS